MRENPLDTNEGDVKSSATARLWTKDFVVVLIVNFSIFCSFQLFPSALPLYVKELGVSDAAIGWIAGVITISALSIRPISGMVVDKFGRKGILILSLCIMLAASFSYSFLPLFGVLLLLRFVHGIGWGITSTATSTIASDIIPLKRFGEGMGFVGLSGSLALAIAPAVGIAIFQSYDMATVSYIATAALVVSLVLSQVIHYREIPKKPAAEKRQRESLFEKKAIYPAFLITFLTAAYGSIVSFVAVYAASMGIHDIGIFFTVYAIALLITRPYFGRLVDRKGTNSIIVPGFLLAAFALILLAFASKLSTLLVVGALFGVAFGALQSSLQTMAVASVPPERRGAANATYFFGFDLGIGLGSIVSGLVATFLGYAGMFLLFASLPIISMLVHLWRRKATTPSK